MGGSELALMLPFTRAMDRFAGALETIGRGMQNFAPQGGGAPGSSPKVPALPGGGGFANIGKSLSGITGLFGKMGPVVSTAVSGLVKFASGLGAASLVLGLGKKIPIVGDLAKVGQAGFGMVLKKFTAGLNEAYLPLGKFSIKADATANALDNAAEASQAYSKAILSSGETIKDALGGLQSGIKDAMVNPLAGLPALAEKIKPFVNAINPFVVEQFDDAMRSVYAVIGEALVPVMKMAAEVVREFAGYLRPALEELRPVFAQMAQVAGGFLKDIIPEIVSLIQELAPSFRLFLDQLRESVGAQKEAMKAGLLYATGQIGALEYIRRGLTRWLSNLPLVGRLFKDEQAKEPFRKDLVKKENIFSFGAPTAPSYRSSESLGRDTLQAAYAAMPGFENQKDERDLLAEIAANTKKTADEIAKNQPGVVHKVAEGIGSSVEWLNQKLGGGLQKGYEASQEAVYPVPVGGFGLGASMLKGMDLGIRI